MRRAARPTSWPAFSASNCKQITGQSFVVENKPGANGIVAINEMANSKPDGYTLMIGNVTTNTITPVLTPDKLPNYDKNVVAISRLVDIPEFLVVTTTQFQRQDRSRADRVRQEESRQAALRHASAPAAIRTTTWPSSPRRRATST